MVTIHIKYINCVQDLTFQDEIAFKDVVNKAQNGVLEIQVEDNGIGIRKEDLNKMFKLFGYLESTQDINPKGIGLGLHIC